MCIIAVSFNVTLFCVYSDNIKFLTYLFILYKNTVYVCTQKRLVNTLQCALGDVYVGN
jgi:hypothetical protein